MQSHILDSFLYSTFDLVLHFSLASLLFRKDASKDTKKNTIRNVHFLVHLVFFMMNEVIKS